MARRPHLHDEDMFFVDAWHVLGSERAPGYGFMGAIPVRAVTHWADLHGLNFDNTMILVAVISRLDHDRAEREASKRDLEARKGTKK